MPPRSEPNSDEPSELSAALGRWRAGVPEALDEVIELANARMRVVARAMLSRYPRARREAETDDVVNLVYLRLDKSLTDKAREAGDLQSAKDLLCLIAYHMRYTLLDLIRKHERRLDVAEGGSAGAGPRRPEPTAPSSEGGPRMEDWAALHEAIAALPDELRRAMEVYWYHGLRGAELADVLGLPERTARRRIREAKLRLEEMLRCGSVAS